MDDAPNDTSKGYKVDGFKVRTEDNVQLYVLSRDIREGWPLLTVETEVNRDSKSTNERGPSLVGSSGLSCLYNGFFSAFSALVGPVQNIFFLVVYYFNSFVPITQQSGQAVVLGHLSQSMCLWLRHRT